MFLINSRRSNIRCGRSGEPETAGLIPKLRPLFCRVPWGAITRSPWSSRPGHLCRFWGTVSHIFNRRSFSWKRAPLCLCRRNDTSRLRSELRARIFLKRLPHGSEANPITLKEYNSPSLRRIYAKSWNINHVSIESGFRHSLRPD